MDACKIWLSYCAVLVESYLSFYLPVPVVAESEALASAAISVSTMLMCLLLLGFSHVFGALAFDTYMLITTICHQCSG